MTDRILVVWSAGGKVQLYPVLTSSLVYPSLDHCDDAHLFGEWNRKSQIFDLSLVPTGIPPDYQIHVLVNLLTIKAIVEDSEPLVNSNVNLADYSRIVVCGIKYGG